jgi:general secretion pathway protein K
MARPALTLRPARGAALLSVIAALAILTALAADVAYDTRVSLESAANARDELRAEYLARSGVTFARLVLVFQSQIDGMTGQVGTQLAQLGGGGGGGGAGIQIPRIQLWNLVPVSSSTLGALFGEPSAADGAFEAKLDDEGSKVSARLDAVPPTAQLAAFFQLVGDPKWDFLFDREDENGVKVTRQDLAIHLYDWVDQNDSGAALSANGLAFENGFGDENYLYDRGEDRYRAKNGRFDSLDELYLVAGVSDAFMAAFRDRLTVYLPPDSKLTVDPRSRDSLLLAAHLVADPMLQPIFSDGTLGEKLQTAVLLLTQNGTLGITRQQFAGICRDLQIQVSAACLGADPDRRCPVTDRSTVFGVQATGSAGGVTAGIDAVLSTAPRTGAQLPPLGRLLHWHGE